MPNNSLEPLDGTDQDRIHTSSWGGGWGAGSRESRWHSSPEQGVRAHGQGGRPHGRAAWYRMSKPEQGEAGGLKGRPPSGESGPEQEERMPPSGGGVCSRISEPKQNQEVKKEKQHGMRFKVQVG